MGKNHVNIIFRTDASLQIGSGHVMRCLTLADELQQRGAEIMFICREHCGHLIDLIEGKGYPVARLPQAEVPYTPAPDDVAHAAWLGVSWQKDAAETVTALGTTKPHWLIVDHYALDGRWGGELRPRAGNIMVIDDLADRPHDCDLLLDQNLYLQMETRYDGLVAESCQRLLGPRYALLRPEFATARRNLRQRDGKVKRVLVFFGGVDPGGETQKALQVLASLPNREFAVDVVVGGGSMHKKQIQEFCATYPGFHYYCHVGNMAELMAAADLSVGAGGTATWERCAVGLPSLVLTVAENQKELAKNGAQDGLFFFLGDAPSVSPGKLLDSLKSLLALPETLQFYSRRCLSTVDARGAGRIANLLLPPQIDVRRATPEDVDAIYQWRNAEETRRYIFNSEPISLESHRSWYFAALQNPNRLQLIGESDGKPVGVLRYDLTGSEALISVYLVPGGQGQGVGSQLIRCGSRWMRMNYTQVKTINAEIFRENAASLRAFELARYKEHHLIFQETL